MLLPAKTSPAELLEQALKIYSVTQIALELGKNESTIHRWQAGACAPELVRDRLERLIERNLRVVSKIGDFRFIDLFAGIGGLRTAFSGINGQCVFTSEWDAVLHKLSKYIMLLTLGRNAQVTDVIHSRKI